MRAVRVVFGLTAAFLLLGGGSMTALAASRLSAGPIQVLFVPSEFASHYTIEVTNGAGRPLTYKWHLDPPQDDPGCNHFSQQPDNSAIWHHGDQDGCNHNVQVQTIGHPGTVQVTVSDGLTDCVASYFGTEPHPGAVAAVCTAINTATTPNPTPQSTGAPSGSAGLSPWLWIVALVILVGAGFLLRLWMASKDPCRELRDRCRELQALAAAAAAKATAAQAAATAAKQACEDAKKAREKAERRVKAAAEGGGSWIEGSEHPGKRLTSLDLQLQSQYEAEIRAQVDRGQLTAEQGQEALSHWDDPQQWDRLRKQERDKADAELASAKAAEGKACADADRLAAEAASAAAASAAAAKAAAEACAAADECEKARREQAATTPVAQPPTPATVSPPTPATPPTTVSPPTPATPPASTPPPPTKTKPKDECSDSDPPRIETRCETEVDMYRMTELTLEIDGQFAMGQEAVDQAMAGLDTTMWVIDMGTLAVSALDNAPLAAGTWIAGKAGFPSFDTITSLPTDAALDGLRKLIEKMRDLRQAGYWTLKCNRYHLKARCEVTWSCVGGHWTVTDRKMTIEQVGGPTPVTSQREYVVPPKEVNRAMTKMANTFRGPNRTAQAKLDACAKACAR